MARAIQLPSRTKTDPLLDRETFQDIRRSQETAKAKYLRDTQRRGVIHRTEILRTPMQGGSCANEEVEDTRSSRPRYSGTT
jgi:hypothetical protein